MTGLPDSVRRGDDPGALLTRPRVRGLAPLTRLRVAAIDRMVGARNRRAERRLKSMSRLWQLMTQAAAGTDVTGASYSDYLTLYEQVRFYKPREVLECGAGISTTVLAQALVENSEEGHGPGRVTSMEEDEEWAATARARLPDALAPLVDIVHSPKVDGFYKCFRGVQYMEVPERAYDFVFSAGPERHSPVNNDKLFNLDLIHVVRRTDAPVRAVVDNHYLTFYVLQKVFGPELARYSVSHKLMFVGPVTRHDLRHLRKDNFLADVRVFGASELKLRMATDDQSLMRPD